jgi:hypothetical protein
MAGRLSPTTLRAEPGAEPTSLSRMAEATSVFGLRRFPFDVTDYD